MVKAKKDAAYLNVYIERTTLEKLKRRKGIKERRQNKL